MGAQYSTGTTSPEWRAWLEERCSLETLRSFYQDFRVGMSHAQRDNIDSDDFFITAEEFRRVSLPCRPAIERATLVCFLGSAGGAINACLAVLPVPNKTFYLGQPSECRQDILRLIFGRTVYFPVRSHRMGRKNGSRRYRPWM